MAKETSRFSSVRDLRNPKPEQPKKLSAQTQAKLMSGPDAPGETPPLHSPGRGRPRGKRSNPDYEPTTLLLRKDTKRAVSRRLEDEGGEMDLSDLVQHLLANWLKQ